MSERHVDELRRVSTEAFGQRYRLECMLAVASKDDGIVSLSELAEELAISVSNLQQPLKSLVSTGLLSPIPVGDSRRKFYLRNESAAWAWARELSLVAEHVAVQ